MNFSLPESQYSKPAQRAEFFETLLARVRNIPGVQAAGFGAAVPGQGYYSDSGFLAEEHAPLPVGQSQSALFRTADPGYFAALGIPFLRGETFAASQRLDRAMKVVINDLFAVILSGRKPGWEALAGAWREVLRNCWRCG
jgi:hypothetical protein